MSEISKPDPALCLNLKPIVIDEWTDYNGHMNVAYYMRAFDMARDAFLSENEMEDVTPTLSPCKSRVSYLQEVHGGKELTLTARPLGVTQSSIHLLLELWETHSNTLAARAERIDITDSQLPDTAQHTLSTLIDSHTEKATPEGWGTLAL